MPDRSELDGPGGAGLRVAMALPAPPRPQGGALDRCLIGELKGLRHHGVHVEAVAADLVGPHEHADEEVISGVTVVRTTAPAGTAARLAHVRRPLGDLSRTGVAEAVRAVVGESDLLHLQGSLTTWLDEGTDVPSVLSMHYRSRLDEALSPDLGTDNRRRLLFRRLERAAIRRHRWLVASSGPVADAIRADRPGADVTVVSLSVDPDAYPPSPVGAAPRAGVIGTASWAPTASALRRLVTDIWPAVRRAVPDAELRIAGRGTADWFAGPPPAGVDVLGEVRRTQDFLQGIGVLLYPVSRGSGMKVKVLEAIASGVPVVTTSAGAEGCAPSEGVLVADDDRTFIEAAVGLLSDGAERQQRGDLARLTFLQHHAPIPATEPLVALYARMLTGRGRR